MTDKKKPEEFDPDKTIVDVRPRTPEPDPDATGVHETPSDDDAERTMVVPRSPTKAPVEEDSDRTVLVSRPPGGGAPDLEDRTVMTSRPASAPAAESRFLLVSLSGPSRGQRFPLAGAEVLVGSNPSCSVKLRGTEGVHARLKPQGDEDWEITNLGTPGSILLQGGRKATRSTLRRGELVKIGEEVLRFVRAGEVFSAEFADSELEASGLSRLLDPSILREKPLYGVIGGLAVVVLALLLWPAAAPPPPAPTQPVASPASSDRAQEVKALLTAGQLLFNQGRYVAPPDRPDEDSAYSKLNEVLALDPGNQEAQQWLAKIDDKLGEARRAREEAERRRREAEEAALAAKRQEFERKIQVILAEGDELFEVGKIGEPAGDNALAKYRQALELDPDYRQTHDRIRRAVFHYVQKGDDLRDRGDRWRALEQYRKANRSSNGEIQEIVARVNETEAALRSGMVSTQNYLVMYKDDRGQLFVLDEMEKVPAKYRDRAVEVKPQPKQEGP